MTVESFQQTLSALVRTRPFRRFRVELVSGSSFEVHHPEAIAFQRGVAVYLAPDNSPVIFDSESVCQIVAEPGVIQEAS
ncbi:MAG: hypothetical protein HY720_11710 [Planctomycetes bacterium]|nr:hypothetical protein [Planctomycetota bacterium]